MKFAIYLLLFLVSTSLLFADIENYDCKDLSKDPIQKHMQCQFKTIDPLTGDHNERTVNFLHLKGTIEDTAYWHGFYLKEEVENGAINGIMDEIEKFKRSLPGVERKFFDGITSCLMDNYIKSVSKEFIKLHKNLQKGLRDAGSTKYSFSDLFQSSLMVEMSIYAEGFMKKLSDDKDKALVELAKTCTLHVPDLIVKGVINKFKNFLKFGCTGIGATGNYTTSGNLIHSRNFDTALFGVFEKYPVVIFLEPPKGYRYVGVASAGLHYAAGISGFNEKGISVSSHELQTEEYRAHAPYGTGTTAPFLMTTILQNAASIDEAFEIVKAHKHFGAWTILIGDSKTNEFASIELTGKRVAIVRSPINQARPQTNHFLSPDMVGANYEYSFNKTLESRSRLFHVGEMLENSKGSIDAQWMINMLADHIDYYEGLRSFGRTVTKGYTTMSHVMIPNEKMFYMSLGETYPVPNSTFVGFKVNFDSTETGLPSFEILDFKRAHNPNYEPLKNWTLGLRHYALALQDYEKRIIEPEKLMSSYENLSKAMELAMKDGIFESPYYYVRGRVSINLAAEKELLSDVFLKRSIDDFIKMIDIAEKGLTKIHPYQMGLAYLWLGRAMDLLSSEAYKAVLTSLNHDRDYYYTQAKMYHEKALVGEEKPYFLLKTINSYFDGKGFPKYDLKSAKKDSIDFVTIE